MSKTAVDTHDWRLLGSAYVEFLVRRDRNSQRLMEREPYQLVTSMGRLAVLLTDQIKIPAQFGVPIICPWIELDLRRRRDPELAAILALRERYLRLGAGYTLRPVHYSRKVAGDIARMLCDSWSHQHDPDSGMFVCDIVPAMLADLRNAFCHSSHGRQN